MNQEAAAAHATHSHMDGEGTTWWPRYDSLRKRHTGKTAPRECHLSKASLFLWLTDNLNTTFFLDVTERAKRNKIGVRTESLRSASLERRNQVLALECSMKVTEWPGLETALSVTAGESGDTANSSHLLTWAVLTFLSDQGPLLRRLQEPGNQRAQSHGPGRDPRTVASPGSSSYQWSTIVLCSHINFLIISKIQLSGIMGLCPSER